MTIGTEITRIKTNIENAYTALGEKGATMPEVQNSDNLAETVGSVSTGGGESSKKAIFKKVDDIISSIDGSVNWITANNVSEKLPGWSIHSKANIPYLFCRNRSGAIGYVLSDDTPNPIYVISDAVIATEGSVVEEFSNISYQRGFKITFPEDKEKFIIFNKDNVNASSLTFGFIPDKLSNTLYQEYAQGYITYANITMTDETTLSALEDRCYKSDFNNQYYYMCQNLGISTSARLEDFKLNNIVYSFSWDNTKRADSLHLEALVPISNNISSNEVIERCTDIGYGNFTLSASCTNELLVYPVYSKYFANFEKFPFVLDCSSLTSKWYIGATVYSNTYSNTRLKYPYEFYAILPNQDVDCFIRYRPISIKTLRFMAENAPTVSGKTLTIGEQNIALANQADTTIIETLTNKGWTVK